jgi:hypothetical protein
MESNVIVSVSLSRVEILAVPLDWPWLVLAAMLRVLWRGYSTSWDWTTS